MRLALATYNVHRCIGTDGRYDPGRVVAVLKELDADVIALQELDSPAHHGLELLESIANELKLIPIAGPTLLERKCHYGNAILTRCAPMEVRLVDLSQFGREPRGAIDLDIQCEREHLQIVAAHLGLKPSERRIQVEKLLKHFGTKHCILMGDLNEWFLWGRPLRWIKAIFGHTPSLRTFPSRLPVFALDRIWVRPPGTLVEMTVHKTPLSFKASDHLPLKATIEL
ncbi:MAG: endonuclease/exonuclease/phosphatase family protein [Nitrospiraceae bacterium]